MPNLQSCVARTIIVDVRLSRTGNKCKKDPSGGYKQHEEQENHHFVLAVPFREVNTKRIVEALQEVDPAFTFEKGDYNRDLELIVVKHIGNKKQALDYMSAVLKNKKLFDGRGRL